MKTDSKYSRFLFLPIIIIIVSALVLGYNLMVRVGAIKQAPTLQEKTERFFAANEERVVEEINWEQFYPEIVSDNPIDINSATVEQLDELPQIGEERARAIVETRSQMCGFKTVRDLLCVDGIGISIFKKIAGLVTVLEYDAAVD